VPQPAEVEERTGLLAGEQIDRELQPVLDEIRERLAAAAEKARRPLACRRVVGARDARRCAARRSS
jgi:hypothetical protein